MTTTTMTDPAAPLRNRFKLFLDLALTGAMFIALTYALPLARITPAGPFAVVGTVVFATWRLWASGSGWRQIGLGAPKHWWTIPAWVVLLYVGVIAVSVAVVIPLTRLLHWPAQDLSRFAFVRGNIMGLATMLGVS